MDEESGVKVTRLRRRLSVESEGVQSPATPSTPTKKRGTRLAKPALELIDENVTENVTKKTTRKSIARNVAEPIEDKPVTPGRRSARIRSNTSLVLEAAVDSPRARRAASRRNSQLGSDTETPATPARQNKRTRKDSTSSVERLAITNNSDKVSVQVAEVIEEEQEKEISKDSKLDKSDSQSPTLRKSPRLNKKLRKSIDEAVKKISDKRQHTDKTSGDTTELTDISLPSTPTNKLSQIEVNSTKSTDKKNKKSVESKDSEENNLSLNSAKLINEIETNPKRSSVVNKTTSEIENHFNNEKNTRKRTKSWTTITSDLSTDKDKNMNKLGSGDGPIKNNDKTENTTSDKLMNKSTSAVISSIENKENINFSKPVVVLNTIDTAKFLTKAPTKDMQAIVFLEDSDSNSGSVGKLTIDLQDYDESHNHGDDQCVPVVKQPISKRSSHSETCTVEPMDIDETIPENVTINDFSDKTNSSREEDKEPDSKQQQPMVNEDSIHMKESSNKSKRTSSISQQQELNHSKRKSSIGISENSNDSKIPLNKSDVSLDKSQRKSSITQNEENNEKHNVSANNSKKQSSFSKIESENDKRKSSVSSQIEDDKINESANLKRKSMSDTVSQSLEKTSNDNKSTLVLSQLKDMSANEITNVSKSPNDCNNELSKSVNVMTTETDKKNPSLNYLTSTPLQQKPLQKIAMPINTSIISLDGKTTKVSKTTPDKRVSDANSDSSDDESDEDSNEKSKMIDDEAEEASDNYESGDSRNEEERQYEKNHEIVETGETLESEEEISNDSDYEKDSFIVSSDAEDDDLLSGSGDDLSISDNELKMSKKSKKKYDERKRKEQKKASKEMYESRHKLNESDKSTESKNKKCNRQRLSSLQESDEDNETEPKKKNRRRIDSSQDLSLDNSNADESITVKKKKTKRLSEFVGEEDADPNEKEITICNQSAVDNNDPLSVAVKQEPKTPQKGLEMSTVTITDNIEEVQVDSNASIMKSNETSDPLQESVEESDSDISENMEIKTNYDSVLENLNNSNIKQKPIKTKDTSLNLNVNKKDKAKEPLVDQLNLTQVKKSKAKSPGFNEIVITVEPTSPKATEVSLSDDGETSDSIDMRLLFPEDSNDSETNSNKFKPDNQVDTADVFIPLKRTEAKTNVRESMELNKSKNDSELNASASKKKNKKSISETATESEDTNVSFFIDTKGSYLDIDSSVQNSAKKNKKKHKANESTVNVVELTETLVETAAPEEMLVPVSSDKKKKKRKSHNVSQADEPEETNVSFFIDTKGSCEDMDSSAQNSAKKNKKKHKSNISLDNVQNAEDETLVGTAAAEEEAVANVSTKSDKKKKKEKNKSTNISETVADDAENTNVSFFIDTKGSYEDMDSSAQNNLKKKKKHKANISVDNVQNEAELSGISAEVAAPDETQEFVLKRKKKKKTKVEFLDVSQIVGYTSPEDVSKNKKNKSLVSETIDNPVAEEITENISADIDKKKKKKKNKSLKTSEIVDNAAAEEAPVDVSVKGDKKKKKNKSPATSQIVANIASEEPSVKRDKKKKKNKSFEIVDNAGEESDEAPVEVAYKSTKNNSESVDTEPDTNTDTKNKYKKKKKKKNKNKTQAQTGMDAATSPGEVSAKKRKIDTACVSPFDANKHSGSQGNKKRKLSQNNESNNAPTQDVTKNNKSKKRKASEDVDAAQKKPKVFKESSFDKVHIPRLPESIVNQLDDKPEKETRKQKKAKAISTAPFLVEDAQKRKNKPSNYLEQSIYLNDSPVKQKQKTVVKNPKVLPFIPTAITSGKGYTSNFEINVLPQETQFIAQASDMTNFRAEFLSNQRIKKLRTFERFKRQRNQKLSKF